MRKLRNILKYSYFSLAFMLLFTVPVHAYIDPSVMTYAIQAIAGVAIAVGTVLGLYWRKILKFFRTIFRVRSNKHSEEESDDIGFNDPKLDKRVTYTDIKQSEIKESKDKFLIVNKEKQVKEKKNDDKQSIQKKVLFIIRDMLPGILISVVMFLMLFMYAPLEIYMNNKLDFWYDYEELMPQLVVMCKWAISIGIVFYITCYLIHKKFYYFTVLAGFSALVILYIHGNYYAGNLPGMDGSEINWVDYTREVQVSILICLITIAVIALIYRIIKISKMTYFIDFVCITISIMLSISLVSIKEKNDGEADKSTGEFQVTSINEFDYSEDENFIIFLVDAFDSETFYDLINQNPEYKEYLKDFTYYPDTVCAYPFTSRSIPFILSGQWYENEGSFVEFASQAVNESPLLNTLEQQGYRLDMYESEFFYDTDKSRYSNVVETELVISDDDLFRKDEMDLAMYKYAPYFLKGNFEIDLDTFNETKDTTSDDVELWPWDDTLFYQRTQTTDITKTSQKVFKFIHLEGAHIPNNLDENMNEIEEGTYPQKQQACITMINTYLNKLKENGVYDNSRIIIMADHGYDYEVGDPMLRDNALFMVKSIGEDHEFQINESPISYDDLQGMYQNLLNGADGNTCFEGLLEDNDNRRYLFYGWSVENEMKEYYQTGYATNQKTMVETGNIYSKEDTSDNESEGILEKWSE